MDIINKINFKENILILLVLMCLSVTLLGIPVIGELQLTYYLFLAILAIFFSTSNQISINIYVVFFVFSCIISLIFNDVPSFYNSWPRLLFLFLVLLSFSPFIVSKKNNMRRECLFKYIMIFLVMTSIVSFFCYTLGVNYSIIAQNAGEAMLEVAGYFGGITKHSMLLGPVSGIACSYLFVRLLYERKKFFFVIFSICFFSLLLSASRVALIATLCSLSYVFIHSNIKGMSLSKKVLAITVVILMILPFMSEYGFLMEAKQQNNLSSGAFTSSREVLWKNRFNEFVDSPIYGCGFASEKETRGFILENGVIEPGTSWGAIFAQTGLLGGISFLILFFRCFQKVFLHGGQDATMKAGILIFFAVHMCAEGYALAGGSPLCVILWLTMTVSYIQKMPQESND